MARRDRKKPQPTASAKQLRRGVDKLEDYLDEEEIESFPASDPHSDWAGPPTWMQETPARASRGDGERRAPRPG